MTTQLAEREPTPMGLIAAAVENGADPDKLEKLLALQERWEANQAEKAFAAAMNAAQQDMPAVARDAENKQTHSRYALLETVQRACKPVYEKHGFSLSFGEADCTREGYKRTTCEVRHAAGACHAYHLDLPVDGIGPKGNAIGGMNAVQGCISTTSYAQRRLVCMIFNVTIGGEDDDGNGPTACITGDQIAELNGIMDRIHPDDNPLAGLLKWAGIESLDKLPAAKFETAKRALLSKVAE